MFDTIKTLINLLLGPFIPLPIPTISFTSQTVIITGSNTGLGFEAARHITRLGAERVILAVRSPIKGEVAKASIEKSTGRTGVVEAWPLDLSSYDSVIRFAERANKELKRLDCVLSNAGVVIQSYSKAEDNELSVTVNVVSTFLLAILLLPALRKTAAECKVQPRMPFVVSDLHVFFSLDAERKTPNIFDKLNSEKGSRAIQKRYPVTKTMEVLLARELSARLTLSDGRPSIIVNYLNPAFCQSDLGRNAGWAEFIDRALRKMLGRKTEVGSRTLVHGAGSGEESHGKYLDNCEVSQPSKFVQSKDGKATQVRLWGELIAKLEKVAPGISGLVDSK